MKLINDSIHAFPFLSTTHAGEQSRALISCPCVLPMQGSADHSQQRVMPSNIPLLALENVARDGETMILSLETLGVQIYVWNEGYPDGRQSELQETRAGTECWIAEGESNVSKTAIKQTLHGTSGAQGKFCQDT